MPNFDNAIWWYSCNEAPIFDQMNNIIRLESFELLMCHRYYISDLCQMIERSYARNKLSQKLLVYRADRLSSSDFRILEQSKKQKDAPITINGFISTSKSEKISLEYAKKKLTTPGDDVVIMYEITIDPAIPCSAYADIESISFHPREQEVLFTMGSTFQIDGIENYPSNEKIKRIKLTARDFNLAQLDEMKAKVKHASQATLSILLVRYLIELGEDRVCKRYLNQLLDSKQLENDLNLVSVYNCLGTIYFRQAMFSETLDYYRKGLNTQARLEFSNNNALAEIFNYIGQAHLGLNQIEEAQENLEEGIRIQKREPKHAQQHLATLYCSMGQVAYARREYDDAEENFQLSHDLYNRNTKISHDALEKRLLRADLYIAYGHLKSVTNLKDPTEANNKFEEALKIYKSTLPSSHPKVAEAHIEIVCEYARNKHYQSVMQYYNDGFQILLKTYETKQATSQQDLTNLYAIIGACFAHEKQFDQAMNIWKQSIEHKQRLFLDELLSSTRLPKITLPIRLVESAYRIALEYYSPVSDAPREYLATLHTAAFMYDEAINDLRGENSYLLANLCILQRKFKGSLAVYQRFLKVGNYDLTFMIGILLKILTAKKTTYKEECIVELNRIGISLAEKATDNEATRLRMIINDYLAETYLTMGKYDDALLCSRTSFDLKQRHYSAHHPSLARSCQQIALSNFHLRDYTNAIQYYERAVEIQLDNMPSGHADIRSNYFLMGDCYCTMGKIELADEFYERAQAPSDIETDDEKQTEQDVKALIRMHSNRATFFAKRGDWFSATTSQEEKINLSKEILPTYIIEVLESDDASAITFERLQKVLITRLGIANITSFVQVLRNLVFICFSLARVLSQANLETEKDEDATDLYEQAIQLELKMTVFEKIEEKHLPKFYEELSDAYAKLYTSMTESVQENLLKAYDVAEEAEHQRAIEYRLGKLYFEGKNFSQANSFWQRALEKTELYQPIIKTILEKLIEKSQEKLSRAEDDSASDNGDDGDENAENSDIELEENEKSSAGDEHENAESHSRVQSVKSQRRQSRKSIVAKQTPKDFAEAYFELEDHENALKYLNKYVSRSEDALTLSPPAEISAEQVPMVEFFHSLLLRTIAADESSLSKSEEVQDKDTWIHLLHTYKEIFKTSVRLEKSADEIAKANSATLQICQKLYNIPDHITTVYSLLFDGDLNDLEWDKLRESLPPDECVDILMRLAAYHVANDDQEKGLGIYCSLQQNIENEEISKSAVNYGMLKLLQVYIQADEEYRENIMAVDIRSVDVAIFDRILLCRLIICFWIELEDEAMIKKFKIELFTLQNEMWSIDDLETTDCIGKALIKFQDYSSACLYWNEIRDIYNEMLPKSMITLLYSTDSTFEQILHTIQGMNNDLADDITSVAKSYELLATYPEVNSYAEVICESLEKAILYYDKCPSTTEKIQQLKVKVKALKEQ